MLTFGIFLWLLRCVPAYTMCPTAFETPLITLVLGAAIGDAPVGAHTLFGTAMVLSGVALVSSKPQRNG